MLLLIDICTSTDSRIAFRLREWINFILDRITCNQSDFTKIEGCKQKVALTDEVVKVVDDYFGVVGGVDGALQERRPRAQLRFLQTQTFHSS